MGNKFLMPRVIEEQLNRHLRPALPPGIREATDAKGHIELILLMPEEGKWSYFPKHGVSLPNASVSLLHPKVVQHSIRSAAGWSCAPWASVR